MANIYIAGVPFDAHSSYLRGPALAPPHIRQAFFSPSGNMCTELGIELDETPGWIMGEDWPEKLEYQQISNYTSTLLDQGYTPLLLGGDHSITFPIARAIYGRYGPFNLLHIDAHGDLYHELDGNPFSHGCPFARIMEAGYARRLVQLGLRCMTTHQRAQAKKWGVECHEMKDWSGQLHLEWDGPLYLSLDMDALDPAFVPGVSHREPGGLTTREVIRLIHQLSVPILGADIVELNPLQDPSGMSAMVAARLMKELLGRMLMLR
ncbi:MAG: agmatinase [Bacteroidetes bacterium]|nr:MAG: agmatinase [Bacteroidota bacterium]